MGQRRIGMFHGDVIERGVAGQAGRFEQQLEVHHIVDDDGTLPAARSLPATVGIPRLDDPCPRTEAGGQRLGSLDNDVLIVGLAGQTVTVQVTATDHEAHIVMPLQVFDGIQVLGILLGQLLPLLVTGQFIGEPHAAGKEARAPVVNGHIMDAAVFFNRTRIQDLARLLDNVGLQCKLGHCIVDVVLDEVAFSLLLACATCKNQERHSQGHQCCSHNKGL